MCILSVYTLLKVVGYYDLSVLSMSVLGFQKKSLDGVGGVSSIQFVLDFWNFFNFSKLPTTPIKRSVLAISELVTGYTRSSHGPRFPFKLTKMSHVLGNIY